MSLNRRSFLTKLGLGVAGAIVAPTLAETLQVNARKYFFLQGNPLFDVEAAKFKYLASLIARDIGLASRIIRDPVSLQRVGRLLGHSDEKWAEMLRERPRRMRYTMMRPLMAEIVPFPKLLQRPQYAFMQTKMC